MITPRRLIGVLCVALGGLTAATVVTTATAAGDTVSTRPPGVFVACGYGNVPSGYDCPSLSDAVASAAAYTGGAATVELIGGPFCPITIPPMTHDLTLVGVGMGMFPPDGPPISVDGPEAAMSSFVYDSGHCSADVGFVNIDGFSTTNKMTLRNLAVNGTGAGSIRGLQVTGTNLVLRDVLIEHVPTIGVYYSGFDRSLQVDNSAFVGNGTGLTTTGTAQLSGTTIDGNTNDGLVISGNAALANDTISHNYEGVYIQGYGNTVSAVNTIVGDNTRFDCDGTVSGDWETGASGTNLLGPRCITLSSPSSDIALTDTLGTLDLHGGPTPTVLPTMQAIGTGNPGWCSGSYGTDQREGVYQPQACDIGSVTLTAARTRVPDTIPAKTFDLGDIVVGTTRDAGVTLVNDGGDLLAVSQVSLQGSGFTMTRDGCTYQVLEHRTDDRCAVHFTVTPTARGPMTGSIAFFDGEGMQAVDITAQGTEPATVAGAPTGLNATGGDATAHLTWTAPTDDGGSRLTGYAVRWSTDGASWTAAPDRAGTATSRTISPLPNGFDYRFEVAARNGVGLGPWSAASPAVRVALVQHPTKLTNSGNETITVGDDATIKATLTDAVAHKAIAGGALTLQSLAPGAKAFKTIAHATTSSAGTAAVTVHPAKTTKYRWVYAGTPAHGKAMSTGSTLSVAPVVHLRATATKVRARHKFQLYGTLDPSTTQQYVRLQHLVKGTWVNIGRIQRLAKQAMPDGHTALGFVFTDEFFAPKTIEVRVSGGSGNGLVSGSSAPLAITVTAR